MHELSSSNYVLASVLYYRYQHHIFPRSHTSRATMPRGLILLALLALALLITTQLTTTHCHTSRENPWNTLESFCYRQRRLIPIDIPGCRSRTRAPVCSGACRSITTTTLDHPFLATSCFCCQATSHRIRPRKVLCATGNETWPIYTQRLFFPRIESCGCVRKPS